MTRAWTLMTAMPPTRGHEALLKFVGSIASNQRPHAILCTQEHEPYVSERVYSVMNAAADAGVILNHFSETIPQDPETPGFWTMWRLIFEKFGFKSGDLIVTSEPYGQRLADELGGHWLPYDLNREIVPAKATIVRECMTEQWESVLPDFARRVAKTVTIFGAESNGKTTMTRAIGEYFNVRTAPEWARPYLEAVGPELTVQKMQDIMDGQAALQRQLKKLEPVSPMTVLDTDLVSTLGYWKEWSPLTVPSGLESIAMSLSSDLYIILTSDGVPFEHDQLRYGNDHRELSDKYWISLADRLELNYIIVDDRHKEVRMTRVFEEIGELFEQLNASMQFDRGGF